MEFEDNYYNFIKSSFIRYILRKKVTRTVDYSYGLIVKRVFVYEDNSDKGVLLGQATPWGDILISEYVLESYSERVIDYVFLHELGHVSISAFFRYGYYILFFSSLYISLFSIVKLLRAPILLITQNVSITHLFSVMLHHFCSAILAGFIGMISSWSYELKADLFAYKTLGKAAFLEVENELKEQKQEVKRFIKIIFLYFSPPKKLFWFLTELL